MDGDKFIYQKRKYSTTNALKYETMGSPPLFVACNVGGIL